MFEFQRGTGTFSKVVQMVRKLHILCLAAMALSVSLAFAEEQSFELDIPAQDLSSALKSLAVSTDRQVLFAASTVNGYRSPAISGNYSTTEAMEILLADSDLTYDVTDSNVLLVKATESDKGGDSDSKNLSPAPVRMAQNQESVPQTPTSQETRTSSNDDQQPFEIEEIIVTGTNLRGITNTASPLIQFDRNDIDNSGAPTAAEFIRRAVPQNFARGAAEDQFGTLRSGVDNSGDGTSVNLRGLGTSSTLVLLNGRRLAPSGAGGFVDVSLIPIAAIDRIDIVADGASAIYGSDAVGGVLNFILNDDFEGAETRLRFGPDVGNDYDELQLSQTIGKQWGSGNGLISYEYYDRGDLDTADRGRTSEALDPTDNMPSQQRHSVFASVNQKVSDHVELFGTSLFSKRESEGDFINTFSLAVFETKAESQQISASGGALFDLGRTSSWQGEIAATFGRNEVDRRSENITANQPGSTTDDVLDSLTLDAKLDGDLVSISGGAVKLAVGAQFRDEVFESTVTSFGFPDTNRDLERDVTAIFGELFVPFVGEANSRSGIKRLELTIASRYEDYSDFGDSADPKVGLLWSPNGSLNLRGTWGTSFRAPLLTDLNDFDLSTFIFPLPDPAAASGSSNTFIAIGRNPDLKPEEAESWTVGFDFQPLSIPGFNLSITYFGIEYENRILSPDTARVFEWVSDPTFAPIIDRDFDPAFIAALTARAASLGQDFTGGDLSGVEVFADGRLQNFATTELSGVDLSSTYDFESSVGKWSISVSGTYYDTFEQAIGAGAADDLLGIVYNPADLRLRGGIGWQRKGLSANAFVNYTSGLDDNRVVPTESISSWTTVDLQLAADFSDWFETSTLDGLSIYLSANNLFDREPPFVVDPIRSRNYDPENHDVLGRFVAIGLTYDW